jgi:hypothetical protein
MQKKPKSLSNIIKAAILITAILAVIEIVIIYFMMGDKKPDKKAAVAKRTEEISKPINTEPVKDTVKPPPTEQITKVEPPVQQPPVQQTPVQQTPVQPAVQQKPVQQTPKQEVPKAEVPKPKVTVDTIKKVAPVKKPEPTAKPAEQSKKQAVEITKAADKKDKPATAEKRVAPKSKQLSEDEMGDILSRINAEKARANSKANCIQVLKTSTGNVENWLDVVSYLKSHGFVISGREVVSSNVKGVHINASGSCIKLTIGVL